MLIIKRLSKVYGKHRILDEINLSFQQGEIHGVVGENGAGKTTLFKCISGLDTFEGIVQYDRGILRNETGFLPTVPFFFSNMSGYEYLRLLCNARSIAVKNLNEFNLFDLPLTQYAETYSTGMQKKLAITGLLLQKNEVFILDEPFNGVDISSNMVIKDILLKLKSLNKIIIMSSHIFSSLEDSCDFLHFLKDGKIKASVPKGSFELIENEMKSSPKMIDFIDSIYST
ncbi:MAG: ATP-binding cassette domain-containing protein [Ginsengibacter sp.]